MMLRGVWWCTRRPRWRILSASCTDHLIASYLAILLSRNLQLCIRISVGGVNLGVLLFATLQKKRFCWKMKMKLFILCGAWLAWLFTQMSALLATILRWLTAIFAFGRSNHLETVGDKDLVRQSPREQLNSNINSFKIIYGKQLLNFLLKRNQPDNTKYYPLSFWVGVVVV